jgi:hypothetical protein
MRKLLFCGVLSSGVLLLFSACASQSRTAGGGGPVTGLPEEGDEVKIRPATYDHQARSYEEPWPLGPLSR